MQTTYKEALEAGWIVFPLHPITRDHIGGLQCACGDPKCAAIGKHPRAANWQHTGVFDAQQLDYLEDDAGHFFGNQLLRHHGVLLPASGLLVVDVDGRNGGWPSAEKLAHVRAQAAYIVQSGSGNGEHWYFLVPPDWRGRSLVTSLDDYPGIDFKSTGFVVGSCCDHASGRQYQTIHGHPCDVDYAPSELLTLLDRPERTRFVLDGAAIDYSHDDLTGIVMAIRNSGRDYERWIRVGMGVHHASGGTDAGYALWHAWSAQCPAHDDTHMPQKWHSFGKSASEVTVGTLIEWARADGWSAPVTFADDTDWGVIEEPAQPARGIDLLKPPGIVGEVCDWINSRCAMPRENLAVAAALQIVSNAAGLHYLVAGRNTSLNLITFAIAASRSGKGAVKRCINEANRALGLARAEHGKFKSSQELVRNAIHHQPVIYTYDEFGKQLEKLAGSSGGKTPYLEDLMAELIAMYSEATGVHQVSGDVKRELMDEADKEIARAVKSADLGDGESPADYAREFPDSDVARALAQRAKVENGIVEPWLSFFGLSEPGSFDKAINSDPWLMTGGLLGRALIFAEAEDVPEEKPDHLVYNGPMPEHVLMRLLAMRGGGGASNDPHARIERGGDWLYIRYADDGAAMLQSVRQYWRTVALTERDTGSGLASQALGATELVIKVAGILAASTGVITAVEMAWAHELVKKVTNAKIAKAKADEKIDSSDSEERGDGLVSSILAAVDAAGEITPGVLRQKIRGGRKMGPKPIQAALDHLVSTDRLQVESRTSAKGRVFSYYSRR
jgi:hypothetical protein